MGYPHVQVWDILMFSCVGYTRFQVCGVPSCSGVRYPHVQVRDSGVGYPHVQWGGTLMFRYRVFPCSGEGCPHSGKGCPHVQVRGVLMFR